MLVAPAAADLFATSFPPPFHPRANSVYRPGKLVSREDKHCSSTATLERVERCWRDWARGRNCSRVEDEPMALRWHYSLLRYISPRASHRLEVDPVVVWVRDAG